MASQLRQETRPMPIHRLRPTSLAVGLLEGLDVLRRVFEAARPGL
jgi:hypothetical protein